MAKRTPQEQATAAQQAQAKKAATATTNAKNRATAAKPGEVKVSTPNGFVPVSQWDFGYGKGVLSPENPNAGVVPVAAQPQTPDPYLAFQTLQANRNITLGDADASYDEGGLARSSGFDATGALIQQGATAFNPFSQAMLLQDQFKRTQAGTGNSYAAQGQYNSGAYGRAKEHDARLYAQDFDALKTSAQQGYHGINRARLGTYADNSLGSGQSSFESIYRNAYGS